MVYSDWVWKNRFLFLQLENAGAVDTQGRVYDLNEVPSEHLQGWSLYEVNS